MSDCKSYVSEEDIKALKESEIHIEHVARSRNLSGEKVLSVTDTIRGEKVTNRTLDGLEELYQSALLNIGYQQMGDYKLGITINGRNQIVFENGSWYIYRGDIPHVTTGATLESDGGIWSEENPDGLWVNVGVASVAEDLNKKLEAFKALLASNDGSSHIGFSDGINLKERLTQWFNASDYGLSSKNTPEKNSEALRKLSADVKLNNGGVIIIPPGEYLIGEQSRNAPADHDPDNIRAYGVKDNLRIEGISNDLTIIMYGAKLKLKDGMRFGAFDPETGEPRPYSPTINELKYRADTGFIFNIVENPLCNVVILGGELDGNMSNLILGGQYGDVGRQCDGYGMRIRNYKSLSIKDLTINKMPLDGLYTGDGWYANKYKSPKPTILNNVKIVGCGRDNWSITGNGFYSSTGCLMSEAAQHEVSSNPASNINVETEAGKVYQVVIDNCTLSNGRDANFIVTSQNVNGLSILNSLIYHDEEYFNKGTSAGVWMRGSIVDLHRCTLRNSRILNQRGGKGSSSLSNTTPTISECLITNINIDNSVPSEMIALLNSDKNHMFIIDCTIHIKNPITGKYHLQLDGVTFERSNIFLTGTVNEVENYTGICGYIRNSSFLNSKLISFIKDGSRRYGVDISGTYNLNGSTILTNRVNTSLPETCSFENKAIAIGSDKQLPNSVAFYKNQQVTFSDGVRKIVTASGINNDYSHRGEINNGRMNGLINNPFKVGDLITLNGSVTGFIIDSGSDWIETSSTMTMNEAVVRFQKPTIV